MQYPASINQQYKIIVRVLVVGSLLSAHATFTYLLVASQLRSYSSQSQTELIITENLLSWQHLAQNFLSFPLLQIFLKFHQNLQIASNFFDLFQSFIRFILLCSILCVQVRGMNYPSPTYRFKTIKSRDSSQTMFFYNYGLTCFKSMLCCISVFLQILQKPVS